MILKKLFIAGSLMAAVLFLSSCTKEGPGGNATITGKVTVQLFDRGYRVMQGSYPAADEDVFIVYGTGDDVSNDTKTGPEGTFEFRFLTKGTYKIFVYTKDPLSFPSGIRTVEKEVTLSSNKSKVDAGELIIRKSVDVNDGHALLHGKVYQVNWSKNYDSIIDTTFAYEAPVYLVYEDDATYSERKRVLDNGTVTFPNLIMGRYRVIVYSEDRSDNGALIPKAVTMTIDEPYQQVDFGEIYIDMKK
jgi:hypothetical protein